MARSSLRSCTALAVGLLSVGAAAQRPAVPRDWPVYGGDAGGGSTPH